MDAKRRPAATGGVLTRASRRMFGKLGLNERLVWTREGVIYIAAWLILLVLGLQTQVNLIFLVAGLALGPVVASFVVSSAMLRKLHASRRVPPYAFSGDPLQIDYTLENYRRWTAVLAMFVEDSATPADRVLAGTSTLAPQVFFARVPSKDRARMRWEGVSPNRGRYEFRTMEVVTRSPFGLLERRISISEPEELIVYPTVGHLTRRWHLIQRQASETRRGQRQDRSTQQQEYHGLRDYRPGDSPRWIHWRTSARLGQPMVKEFEQQNEQDLAILLDPWLPARPRDEDRAVLEKAVTFAATLCLETCRRSGRRILLGCAGSRPSFRHGPAGVKLLHEMLEQLAVVRGTSDGRISAVLDMVPPATIREAAFVVVSTRPVVMVEEMERSSRLSGASSRGLLSRVIVLDAAKGDLDGLVQFTGTSSATTTINRRASDPSMLDRDPTASDEEPPPLAAASSPPAGAPSAYHRNGEGGGS